MNGIYEIEIDEVKTVLHFNLFGVNEFQRRMVNFPSSDNIKVLTDLLYGGIYGNTMSKGMAVPLYETANDLMEVIMAMPNKALITENIWNTFNESNHGADFMAKIKAINEAIDKNSDEVKKKASPTKSKNTKKEEI